MRGGIVLAAFAVALSLSAGAAFAAGERLVVGAYPGAPWKRITDKQGPNGWIHEQIPASQKVEGFADILTDQGFVAARGRDPAAFLKTIFGQVGGACEAVRVSGPIAQTEGGFRVAYGQVYCGRQKGTNFGVVIFYKVIGGDEALYSINREFHTPPSTVAGAISFPKGREAEAAAFLKAQSAADQYLANQVYVCGGRSTDQRCGAR
jgi:hypothetical protein